MAAFALGIGSHLLLDSVPHWGCDKTVEGGYGRFVSIARRDGLIGLAATAASIAAVDKRDRVATIAAIGGAVLLDLDKPALLLFGVNPFPRVVSRIHRRVQNESPDGLGREIGYGIALAAADVVSVTSARRSRAYPAPRAESAR